MGLLSDIFGAPGSPEAQSMGLLGAGLMSGSPSQAFAAANGVFSPEAQTKRQMGLLQLQQGQQGVQKGGIELDLLRQQVARANKIRDDLAKLQTGDGVAAPGGVPGAAPSQQFQTPSLGDIPMFSQGTQMRQPQPLAQPQAAPAAAQGGIGRDLSQRLIQQANVYAANGDFEGANKLYEHASKFMPEVKEMGVLMRGNKPVNVITFKDGTQQVTDLQPTPKTHWLDQGGSITPINEYTNQPTGSPFKKSQTPDSVASNAVSMRGQDMTDARARQTAELGTIPAGYRRTPDGRLEYIPGGPADPNAAKKAAPTEFQGKSATYGARALEADKTINALGTSYSPTGINTKASFGRTPMIGGALEAGVNLTLSDNTQRAEQAQRDFLNAVLRQESGAAIGKEEFDNARKQYFPQPGDSQAVKEQKARNRQLVIAGFRENARPGAVDELVNVGGAPVGAGPRQINPNDPLGLRR